MTGNLIGSNQHHSVPFLQVIYQTTVLGKGLDFPESTPAEYRELGERCLSTDPEERPSFQYIVNRLSQM